MGGGRGTPRAYLVSAVSWGKYHNFIPIFVIIRTIAHLFAGESPINLGLDE